MALRAIITDGFSILSPLCWHDVAATAAAAADEFKRRGNVLKNEFLFVNLIKALVTFIVHCVCATKELIVHLNLLHLHLMINCHSTVKEFRIELTSPLPHP